MQTGDQLTGFKKEAAFKAIFRVIREYSPELRFQHLQRAIVTIAPSLVAGLFARKPCLRRLRYIGCTWYSESPSNDEFFKVGQTYVSTTFNGATYTIQGYGKRPIGCAYFEWVAGDISD